MHSYILRHLYELLVRERQPNTLSLGLLPPVFCFSYFRYNYDCWLVAYLFYHSFYAHFFYEHHRRRRRRLALSKIMFLQMIKCSCSEDPSLRDKYFFILVTTFKNLKCLECSS